MSVYPEAHFMVEDSDSHDEEEAGEKKDGAGIAEGRTRAKVTAGKK